MNNQPSSNLEGIIAAKETGIKSLLHSRIETDLNPFEADAVNKWLTKMICVSESVKENFVRQGVYEKKCIVQDRNYHSLRLKNRFEDVL